MATKKFFDTMLNQKLVKIPTTKPKPIFTKPQSIWGNMLMNKGKKNG